MSAAPDPGGGIKGGYPKQDPMRIDVGDSARSAAKRTEIRQRIDEVGKKYGLGTYKQDKAQSSAVDDFYEILRMTYDDDLSSEERAAMDELQKMLASEYNPRTQAQQEIADRLTNEFAREIRGHDYGRS